MIAWLLGCASGDPELAAQRAALDDYERGVAALERNEPMGAVAAFEAAQKARPQDGLLVAWHAQALADAGDPAAAAQMLGLLVARFPDFHEARYNRAAWLARSGDLDLAGAELERALRGGVVRPRQAMVDPDFEPHLDHPAFAFLPDEMLVVAVDAPRDSLFWGSEAVVRLRVMGADGASVSVDAPPVAGPVVLRAAREESLTSSEDVGRDLSWTFEVRGAGEVVIGPIVVRAGRWSKTVEAIRFPTTAPPDRTLDPTVPPALLVVPSLVREGMELPGSRSAGGVLDVLTLPDDALDVRPGVRPARLELLERGQPVWVVHRFVGPELPEVDVRRGGQVVLSARP